MSYLSCGNCAIFKLYGFLLGSFKYKQILHRRTLIDNNKSCTEEVVLGNNNIN